MVQSWEILQAGMSLRPIEIDLSETESRRFECVEDCNLCCLCPPEITEGEEDFFRSSYPEAITILSEPHRHLALSLREGIGPCVFLEEGGCRIYSHRPHFCRQYPFHVHVGERVQVSLDLSCRGLWSDRGREAERLAEGHVAANMEKIEAMIDGTRETYHQFYESCREAGVYHNPQDMRENVRDIISLFGDLSFLGKLLEMSWGDEEITRSDLMNMRGEDLGNEERSFREAVMDMGMESMSSTDVSTAPVYCDTQNRWNILYLEDEEIGWIVLEENGELEHVRTIEPTEVELLPPEGEGNRIFQDYIDVLNNRDSILGHSFYLEEAYGYVDYLANTYYGVIATSAADLLWRASLLAHVNGGKLDDEGVREGIILYDMDRLGTPSIGRFV